MGVGGASSPGQLSPQELGELSDRLGTLLRVGVLVSAGLLLAGLAAALLAPGVSPSDLGSTYSFRTPADVASLGVPGLLVAAGLLLLVGTPVARVILSLVTFARARETDYAALTALVLLALGAGVAVGLLA